MSQKFVLKATVCGRVQGVFFRACTKQEAVKLNLVGYAKNLANGDVEVMAVGAEKSTQSLLDWLWIGSPNSKVTKVTVHCNTQAESDSANIPDKFSTL